MAELVQRNIEKTLPELEQMERMGLFRKTEIKKVIKRRRALEYKIRKRRKTKQDFLKYIQYEVNLLSLIGKRRKRLGCDFKMKEIDHAIAKRINKLFKCALFRYQDDSTLWVSQIDFCKRMKWHHSISALFTRMLQVHNSQPALWTMAAKWEIEENNAPENARQLLQRALRHHPDSQHLWLEYFRMELMYTELVRKRRDVLGVQDVKDSSDENDAVLDGSIALVVYESAVSAIPDVEFALSFIPVCQPFDFATRHMSEIFEDVQNRHPYKEETLNALAKAPLLQQKEEIELGLMSGKKKKNIKWNLCEKVCALYEKAVVKVPSTKMWKFYIDFNLQRMENAKKKHVKLRYEVLDLMQRASCVDCLDSDYYAEWTHLLLSSGDEEGALRVSVEASQKWPQMVPLWHMCISLHIRAKKDSTVISSLFNEALGSINESESFPIWRLGIEWMSLCKPSKLSEFFEGGIQGCREVSLPLKEMYIEVAVLQGGIQVARDLYKKLTRMPPVSLELYRKMIMIENAQLKPSIEWLRRYHEDAIREYGTTDVDLWLNFIKLEVEHPDGDPAQYDMLYWRALKCLKGQLADDLITLSFCLPGTT